MSDTATKASVKKKHTSALYDTIKLKSQPHYWRKKKPIPCHPYNTVPFVLAITVNCIGRIFIRQVAQQSKQTAQLHCAAGNSAHQEP